MYEKEHLKNLFLCSLVLFSVSCNDNKLAEINQNSLVREIMTEELTIQSAQKWFNTKIDSKANSRIESTKTPIWEYAIQTKEKDGTIVITTPIRIDEKNQSFALGLNEGEIINQKKQFESKDYRSEGLSTPQKLVIVQDAKGKVDTYLIKIIADLDYFENTLKKEKKSKAKNDIKDFDGLVLFNDWNETQKIHGLRIEKGKFKEKIGIKEEKPNGRISDCTSYSYQQSAPCNAAKIKSEICSITIYTTSCTGLFDLSYSVPSFSYNYSGGYTSDIISSSYRQNAVDNFISQADPNHFIFNPDDRLDFRDNFEDFLKIKNDLLKTIQTWGNPSIQWLEDKYQFICNILKEDEKNLLKYSSPFGYKTSLFLYAWNAFEATNYTVITMNSIGRLGSIGGTCAFCRGNAIKHASFIIRNLHTFGRWLGKSLADAHEVGTPIERQMERTMDLHNNNIGLILFDAYGPAEANFMLKDVMTSGMPYNNSEGLKFIKDGLIYWTKDYPNEN